MTAPSGTASAATAPPGRTRAMATAALLAALLAASALIAIPIGSVPVTLQTFILGVIVLAISPGVAAVTVGLYLALGLVGLPVFAGGLGGPGVLAGPTGGYLVGFWLGTVTGALARRVLGSRGWHADALGVAVLLVGVYVPGVLWLAHSTGLALGEAVAVGAVPFLPFDAAKLVASLVVARALRRAGILPGLGDCTP